MRIRGGGSSGVLELNIDEQGWDAVCDDYFNHHAATAFCRELGYAEGTHHGTTHGDGTFAADDIKCPVGPTGISECSSFSSPYTDNCGDYETVGITCVGADSCSAGACDCTDDHTGSFCQWPPAFNVSGCSDPAHCGIFLRTNSTCNQAPVFQLPSGSANGTTLYSAGEGGQHHYSYNRWLVGPSARVEDCSQDRHHYYRSDQAPKTYEYDPLTDDWQEVQPHGPTHPGYGSWRRCTSTSSCSMSYSPYSRQAPEFSVAATNRTGHPTSLGTEYEYEYWSRTSTPEPPAPPPAPESWASAKQSACARALPSAVAGVAMLLPMLAEL
eukprot:COSAG04_NODE_2618_length_3845_cov_7.274693_5_plen_326_part_00